MIAPHSVRTNIILAMTAKLASMAVSLMSVPLLLQLLGMHTYGTWATLTSLIAFIGLLDLGFGNSIRNSVAGMQTGVEESVRTEFIAFFQMLFILALLMLAVFAVTLPRLHLLPGSESAAWMLYVPLLLLLPLMLGANVLQGARATGLQAWLQATGGWLFFGLVASLAWVGHTPSLFELALAWSAFYALALAITFAFALRVLDIAPGRLFKWSLAALPKNRLRVSLEFLVLQLSALFLYSLGNTLIFRHLGANEVARYDVLNKVFQVGFGFYTIVIGVMWSEISKHRAASDQQALSRALRRLGGVALLFSAGCMAVAFAAPWIIDQWTRHRVQVTTFEALSLAGLAAVQSMAYVGAVFMNAFERVRVQIGLAIVSISLMMPATSLLVNSGLGIASVPLAATLLTLLPMIVCNIYAIRLVRNASSSRGSHE